MKRYKLLKDLPTFKTGENEEYKRWRAKEGRDYWSIDSFGYASENKDYRTSVSNHYYRIGNHFKTETEAEKYGEYLIALQTIKDDAKGFKPDWKNDEEVKYYGRFNWDKNAFLYNTCYIIQFQGKFQKAPQRVANSVRGGENK